MTELTSLRQSHLKDNCQASAPASGSRAHTNNATNLISMNWLDLAQEIVTTSTFVFVSLFLFNPIRTLTLHLLPTLLVYLFVLLSKLPIYQTVQFHKKPILWQTSVIFKKSSFGRSSSNIDLRCFFHEARDRSRRLLTRTVGWDRHRTGGMPWELNGELGGVCVLTSEIIGIEPLDAVDAPDKHLPPDVVVASSERHSWSGNW